MAKRSNKAEPQQEFERIMRDLEAGKFKPVYFLCGDEPLYIDELQQKIIEMIPPESQSFDYELLYGNDVDPSRILDSAKSYAFSGGRRFVIVREFMKCTERKVLADNTTQKPEAGLEIFIPYFSRPLESTVLVLIDSQKPAGNTRFGKALSQSEHCEFFVSSAPSEKVVLDWIVERAQKKFGKQIEHEAVLYLYSLVGNRLHELSKELEKINDYAGRRTVLTRKDVKEVVKISREYTAFELANALSARDTKLTLYIAERLLQNKDTDTGEIFRMMSLIYGNFTIMWSFLKYSAKGMSPSEIAVKLKVNEWRLKFLAKDASKYRPEEMPLIFEAILDADRAVKGYSKLDPKAVFILMLRRILT
ncbi:MAG: DNA polymerase III subunit delta [Candidatus Cyclonatronum sp.]|uniref:DNA polymerase III subunit delta n=1 Tax=Cyclonatronum sp. TaxID=3024185 RepID=UPI0025B7E2EB|nr:DNA polymerase III subunit delta [Cyclonatronum sp.]MCC5933068.1 DNA polymerase III subunit delta [Balneolales bacterium]MCH8485742.1 DNA polymerase III subunit delta [Cyclonatronum sp.]